MSHLFELMATFGLFLGIPLLFLGIVFWVYRPGADTRYRQDAHLPFEDETDRPPPPIHP